jgi:hypothetical protein
MKNTSMSVKSSKAMIDRFIRKISCAKNSFVVPLLSVQADSQACR